MIGFITTPETAQVVLDGIRTAQESRDLPVFWSTGSYTIFTGEHAGKVFIPADDQILSTNLRLGQTPMDFPECAEMLAALGGLEARIDLDPAAIIDPSAETFEPN
jgi:hypothetical protein